MTRRATNDEIRVGDYALGLSITDGQAWWHSGRITAIINGYYVING